MRDKTRVAGRRHAAALAALLCLWGLLCLPAGHSRGADASRPGPRGGAELFEKTGEKLVIPLPGGSFEVPPMQDGPEEAAPGSGGHVWVPPQPNVGSGEGSAPVDATPLEWLVFPRKSASGKEGGTGEGTKPRAGASPQKSSPGNDAGQEKKAGAASGPGQARPSGLPGAADGLLVPVSPPPGNARRQPPSTAVSPGSPSPGGAGQYDDIPRLRSSRDANGNGINDTDDIIAGGRAEAARRPVYKSAYYSKGGYPPETEGVCTDVIWRAFKHAGYDLKAMMDKDIDANRAAYPHVKTRDANIDFRRVPNQLVFFKRHGLSLTTTIIPGDKKNLAQWQPGDIVTFKNPNHIAILSDKRNARGIPLLIHNQSPVASEGDDFMNWYGLGCTGHFRFPPK